MRLWEHKLAIYECNDACGCDARLCRNRVVQRGVTLPLQVPSLAPAAHFGFARSASCASFCEPERRPARAAQVFRCTPRAKGWGVRCKRRIPAGGFVSEYAGELLTEAQAHARGIASGDEYLFDLDAWAHDVARERLEREDLKAVARDDGDAAPTPADAREETARRQRRANAVEDNALDQTERGLLIIDAKRYGNVGRFINHSCAPNLVKQVVFTASHDVRSYHVAFFAACDIPAFEELTYDYGYDAGSVAGKRLLCRCGAPSCRGRLL